jgi:hypothetical protein
MILAYYLLKVDGKRDVTTACGAAHPINRSLTAAIAQGSGVVGAAFSLSAAGATLPPA